MKKAAILTLAMLGVWAQAAPAAPPVSAPGALAYEGPVLSPSGAAWATSITQPAVSGFAVRALDAGGTVRTLFDDPSGRTGGPDFGRPDIAASKSRIAFSYSDGQYLNSPSRAYYTGPSGLTAFGDGCPQMSLDLDGDLLAYGCAGRGGAVKDLGTGAPVNGGSSGYDTQIAGRYLAWVEPVFRPYEPEVVVYDRLADREVYRINVQALLPPADFTFVKYDLRSDGTLVAAYNNYGSPATLAWFSPAEPHAHVITSGIAGAPSVASGRIAVIRRSLRARFELAVIDFSGATLQVFDLDDSGYTPLGVDFDGTRLAWHTNVHGVRLSNFPVETDSDLRARYSNAFSIAPTRFRTLRSPVRARSTRRQGATVRFVLQRRARVRVIVERRTTGILRRGTCRRHAKRRGSLRCIRYTRAGTLRLGPRSGAVRYRFRGHIAGKRLKPGRYRLVLETQVGNRVSRERAAAFRILR